MLYQKHGEGGNLIETELVGMGRDDTLIDGIVGILSPILSPQKNKRIKKKISYISYLMNLEIFLIFHHQKNVHFH